MRDTTLFEEFLLVPEFADLPEDGLMWLASQATDTRFLQGEKLITQGDPANIFTVLLEGEIRFRRESVGGGSPVYIARAPEVGGVLPLSRMTEFTFTAMALTDVRVAIMPVSLFPEMMQRLPALNMRLANVMSDRIRWATEVEQQHEKLKALGKLAGGLAHELNNPAAAARRATQSISSALGSLRESTLRLGLLGYPDFAWQLLFNYEQAALQKAAAIGTGLERIDREERVTAWMQAHGVQDAWTIAAALADWDVDIEELEGLAERCPTKFLAEVLVHICSVLTAERLLLDVHSSLVRISDLVSAVKDYSFMDQQQVRDIDLHEGLENTLTMMNYRMEKVRVLRDFDFSLPKVCANGGSLNQIWTNLIENALDAMRDDGELRIRTALELDCALIEICDDGPGVPLAIQGRIFEPFYTTKAVGQGTGLGLDMVRKLLWNHNGSVMVESKPGDTRFQVRLPLNQTALAVGA